MNFIEEYDCLSEEECKLLIEMFEKSPNIKRSLMVGQIYDDKRKKSYEMPLAFAHDNEECSTVSRIIFPHLSSSIQKYIDKYPSLNTIGLWDLQMQYHMQRFQKDEGYFVEHCEQCSKSASTRMLVFMFYLNNCSCGTHFKYQDLTLKPEAGKLVLWPASWTHTHKGVTPNLDDKYIITGWWIFC